MIRRNWFQRNWLVGVAAIAISLSLITPASAEVLPKAFLSYAQSPYLAHPGIIVIDPATDQTLFSNQPDSLRAPASVLKLLSMATAIHNLGGDKIFHTTLSTTTRHGTYLLQGESDPWLTASPFEAKKYHRAFSPELINRLIAQNPGKKRFTIDYNGIYTADRRILKRYFAPRVALAFHLVTPLQAKAEVSKNVAEIASPTLNEMVKFTLLWSDNLLADRLARTAAHKLGYAGDALGIQLAMEETLGTLGVETKGLVIKDGNGLSKATRVSARTVAQLLLKVANHPEYLSILEGLPLAGKTGTLKSRFITDAPSAVGLVKAKTGWINGTVSLAGFVTVGSEQYVFTVIADHVKQNENSRQLARQTIDRMLATIAKPRPHA